MGLDVNLYRLTTVDANKLVAYNAKSRSVWRRSVYCLLKRNDPIQKHLTKDERHNECLLSWNSHVTLSLSLPDDIERIVMEQEEEIDVLSAKHPPYSIGYFRSGYMGGGIDAVLRAVVGKDLYHAFPEASEMGGYIKPNWRRSQQRLQKMLMRFQALGPDNAKFNKAIGVNIESAQNIIAWLNPTGSKGGKIAEDITASMVPAEQFQDYLNRLGAILETVEYVLAQPDIENYVFYWSA